MPVLRSRETQGDSENFGIDGIWKTFVNKSILKRGKRLRKAPDDFIPLYRERADRVESRVGLWDCIFIGFSVWWLGVWGGAL